LAKGSIARRATMEDWIIRFAAYIHCSRDS